MFLPQNMGDAHAYVILPLPGHFKMRLKPHLFSEVN
jgi:hypothetical protein